MSKVIKVNGYVDEEVLINISSLLQDNGYDVDIVDPLDCVLENVQYEEKINNAIPENIIPEFTEVIYKGKKCFIMGNNDDLSDLNYYIKYADSLEEIKNKYISKDNGIYFDEMVSWNEIEIANKI